VSAGLAASAQPVCSIVAVSRSEVDSQISRVPIAINIEDRRSRGKATASDHATAAGDTADLSHVYLLSHVIIGTIIIFATSGVQPVIIGTARCVLTPTLLLVIVVLFLGAIASVASEIVQLIEYLLCSEMSTNDELFGRWSQNPWPLVK